MRKAEHKRLRVAWLLLLVYLPMLLAVTFHHHTEVEGSAATTYYCYDCAHHIHHDGHFVNGNTMHDCALCVLQSMTYVAPSFAQLTTFVVVLDIVYCAICILIKRCRYDVKSTRAPPVFS